MGQSLTRLPDLPGPEVRHRQPPKLHPTSSKHGAISMDRFDARLPLRLKHETRQRDTLHSSSRHASSHRIKGALSEIDGNPRQARSTTYTGNHQRRPRRPRASEKVTETNIPKGHRERKSETSSRGERRRGLSKSRSRLSHADQATQSIEGLKRVPFNNRSGNVQVNELKECMVCVVSKTTERFPGRAPTTQCEHNTSICRRCLRQWIKTQFETVIWDQISCPECGVKMRYEDVKEFAPSAVFRRYDALSTRAALESIPGFRWCMAKGCRSGQVNNGGDVASKFSCVACKESHCITHQIPWHKGETCAEYDYRTDGTLKKAEEDASKRLIQEVAKKCPNPKCKWNIEKTYGCDHMTCSKCKHEFCWECLADYKGIRARGNRLHRPGCVHST